MQSLILLCTLSALAGLPLGYGIGWAWDAALPYLQLAWKVLVAIWLIDRIGRECDSVFTWCWAHDIRAEPFLDTEAEGQR